jgi:hypothetical protein
MKTEERERMTKLLKAALPPVEAEAEPARDLWPAVLRRMDGRVAAVPWFDWALLAGLLGLAALAPASIPVLLYYL